MPVQLTKLSENLPGLIDAVILINLVITIKANPPHLMSKLDYHIGKRISVRRSVPAFKDLSEDM